ncbi:hypothetical protein HYPDE_26988 [Hyphomicrobium denitrificans 1NES1]|uniref:Response regulatory domain-containing protein n=1 Tax=Hyphomicrobium denitrificans 1NES1 TaxID=670307 RepID=N0B2B1_9HYPH|nr:hypothetical protein [Hyphomicrobium denitrificans]AGK57078.1 hypothetical protein HYPDE_26988 [Hyphomicrobium denitrificans 1NES1]
MISHDHAPSILIVDRSMSCGWRLCRSLLEKGATIHVFHAFEPALRLLRSKKIDTAMIEFDADEAALEFCREADARSVALVFTPLPKSTIRSKASLQFLFTSASQGFSPSDGRSPAAVLPNDFSTPMQ